MFLFLRSLSQRHRGAESGAKYVRYLCVLFLFTSFLVLGCKEESGPGLVSLHGTWKSTHDETFIINLINNTYSNPANGEWGDYSVAGSIKDIVRFGNGSAGIIYIEITSKGDMFGTNGTGNFTGVYFKYLDNTTVEFSLAMDSSYATPVYLSLQKAKAALNENSLGNYFASGSACKKQ